MFTTILSRTRKLLSRARKLIVTIFRLTFVMWGTLIEPGFTRVSAEKGMFTGEATINGQKVMFTV